MARQITKEAEFQAMMVEVDASLAARRVAIPWRPILSLFEVGNLVEDELELSHGDRDPAAGAYSGYDLSLRIQRWFEERYGERLEFYWGPGRMAFLLRGDLWTFRYPLLGVWPGDEITFHTGSPRDLAVLAAKGPGALAYDVCTSIEQCPPALASSLTEAEQDEVLRLFMLGFGALNKMSQHAEIALVRHALSDHDAAVAYLTAATASPNQSKWASLQASEKMFKAYIASRKKAFPRTHNLRTLATVAAPLGLGGFTLPQLDLIQCDPSIRYDATSVSREDAVSAHQTSLHVSGRIAEAI